MKREEFAEIIGDVRDDYVEEAGSGHQRRRWVPWAAAACLLLAVTAAAVGLLGRRMQGTEPSALAAYLSDLGIDAVIREDPEEITWEEPQVTAEELRAVLRETETLLQGTVTGVESARIEDGDTTHFITVAEIQVERDLIRQELEDRVVRLISAASYTGVEVPEDGPVYAPRLGGVRPGETLVFTLRELEDVPWTMCGQEVYPMELADGLPGWVLRREGDTLIYPSQDIRVELDEIE